MAAVLPNTHTHSEAALCPQGHCNFKPCHHPYFKIIKNTGGGANMMHHEALESLCS